MLSELSVAAAVGVALLQAASNKPAATNRLKNERTLFFITVF
jgi:hypothetical protein